MDEKYNEILHRAVAQMIQHRAHTISKELIGRHLQKLVDPSGLFGWAGIELPDELRLKERPYHWVWYQEALLQRLRGEVHGGLSVEYESWSLALTLASMGIKAEIESVDDEAVQGGVRVFMPFGVDAFESSSFLLVPLQITNLGHASSWKIVAPNRCNKPILWNCLSSAFVREFGSHFMKLTTRAVETRKAIKDNPAPITCVFEPLQTYGSMR